MIPETTLWQIETTFKSRFRRGFSSFAKEYPAGNRLNSSVEIVAKLQPELGSEPVFFDENGFGHVGLKEYQLWLENDKRPIYLFDNHQWALLAIADLFSVRQKPQVLVHIDAHRDDAVFPGEIAEKDLADIPSLIERCRVSDYLDAGKRLGLIEKVIPVTQSWEFESFKLPAEPFLLNLDLDIYGPEGEAVPLQVKTEVIAKAWSRADAVILATSPGFLDQRDAAELISIFTNRE